MHAMIAISTLVSILVVGCLLPIMGRTRQGLLFGVTVPLEFAGSAEAKAAVRRYVLRTGLLAIVVFTLSVIAFPFTSAVVAPLLGFIAIPVELLGGFFFWQMERRAIKPHATTVPLVRSAELLPNRHLGGIWASLAAVLPMAAMAVWLHLHWSEIPARWPQHWDAYGHANGWGTRSTAGVYFPLLMGTFIVLMMTGIAGFIALAPGTQTRQRRLALAPLAGLAWLMSTVFCVIALLPMRHNFSPEAIAFAVALDLLATFGIVIWLIVRSGLTNSSKSSAPYDGTPDAMWRGGGLVYYNPTDAAVIVPKRYGFGWTLNMARPVAWMYIGGVVLVITIFSVVPFLMHK
jgi:uncharacterized membrane protein